MTLRAFFLLPVIALAGCGAAVDREVEPFLTITQGVYGQTTSLDDVCPSECEPEYRPTTLRVTGTDPVRAEVSVTSDARGFFEVATEPGDFRICTSFDRCLAFTVTEGAKIRLDYEWSVGPGWSKP